MLTRRSLLTAGLATGATGLLFTPDAKASPQPTLPPSLSLIHI